MDKLFFTRFLKLLSPSQRRKGIFITLLLSLSSLLDFISIAAFFPLIFLLLNPESVQSNTLMKQLYYFLGFTNTVNFAILLTLTILALVIIKTIVNVWATFAKAKFAYIIANQITSIAVSRYLLLSYEQYAQTDRTRELNRFTNMPIMFANNIIIPCGTLFSEALITITLSICVALYDIKAFGLILLILIPAVLIYLGKRNQIKSISNEFGQTYPAFLKYALQIVDGFTDIKSFQKEVFFKKRYEDQTAKMGTTLARDHSSQTAALRITEVIAALCICILIIYSIALDQNRNTLILLSVYAGASFRVIPSINRIFSAIHQIKVNGHVIAELKEVISFTLPATDKNAEITFNDLVEIKKLCFGYPGQSPVLNSVDLSIKKGEKIIITGRSGGGKTALLLLLLRFLKEDSGEISVDGKIITEEKKSGWLTNIGYVSQHPYIQDASILENIGFGISLKDINKEKVILLLEEVDLRDWADTLPGNIHTIIGENGARISGGQKQRLAIARALYPDPEILILDEVTNHLDKQTEQDVIHTLLKVSKKNKTIIMVTHKQELWHLFDSVYELKNGRLEKLDSETKNSVRMKDNSIDFM